MHNDLATENTQDRYLIGFWLRLGASVLDVLYLGTLMMIFLATMSSLAGRPIDRMDADLCAVLALFVTGVYLVSSWSTTGRTPGAWAVSQLLLSTHTGKPPTVLRSLLRLLVMPLSIIPLGLGFFWAGWFRQKRSWHDMLSGTIVVSDASYVPRDEDRVWMPTTPISTDRAETGDLGSL